MRYRVIVRLKNGVLDVQGKAIENGLKQQKIDALSNITVGKVIEMNVEGLSKSEARVQVEEVCKTLLTNPVIEQYEVVEIA